MKIDLQETYDWPISGRDKAMKEKLAEEEEKQHDWRDTDAPSEADVQPGQQIRRSCTSHICCVFAKHC